MTRPTRLRTPAAASPFAAVALAVALATTLADGPMAAAQHQALPAGPMVPHGAVVQRGAEVRLPDGASTTPHAEILSAWEQVATGINVLRREIVPGRRNIRRYALRLRTALGRSWTALLTVRFDRGAPPRLVRLVPARGHIPTTPLGGEARWIDYGAIQLRGGNAGERRFELALPAEAPDVEGRRGPLTLHATVVIREQVLDLEALEVRPERAGMAMAEETSRALRAAMLTQIALRFPGVTRALWQGHIELDLDAMRNAARPSRPEPTRQPSVDAPERAGQPRVWRSSARQVEERAGTPVAQATWGRWARPAGAGGTEHGSRSAP